jgi:hypothetical protein
VEPAPPDILQPAYYLRPIYTVDILVLELIYSSRLIYDFS